jgi:hypothetical protein
MYTVRPILVIYKLNKSSKILFYCPVYFRNSSKLVYNICVVDISNGVNVPFEVDITYEEIVIQRYVIGVRAKMWVCTNMWNIINTLLLAPLY